MTIVNNVEMTINPTPNDPKPETVIRKLFVSNQQTWQLSNKYLTTLNEHW